MAKRKVKQTTERRISAAMRIALVALLFLANLAVIFLLAYYLQTHAVLAYLGLEVVGVVPSVV